MVKKREWRECVVLGKKEFVFEKKILFTAGKEKKRYIYIYIGVHCLKSLRTKRRKRSRKDRKVFYSHMNRRNTSYVQGG